MLQRLRLVVNVIQNVSLVKESHKEAPHPCFTLKCGNSKCPHLDKLAMLIDFAATKR